MNIAAKEGGQGGLRRRQSSKVCRRRGAEVYIVHQNICVGLASIIEQVVILVRHHCVTRQVRSRKCCRWTGGQAGGEKNGGWR